MNEKNVLTKNMAPVTVPQIVEAVTAHIQAQDEIWKRLAGLNGLVAVAEKQLFNEDEGPHPALCAAGEMLRSSEPGGVLGGLLNAEKTAMNATLQQMQVMDVFAERLRNLLERLGVEMDVAEPGPKMVRMERRA